MLSPFFSVLDIEETRVMGQKGCVQTWVLNWQEASSFECHTPFLLSRSGVADRSNYIPLGTFLPSGVFHHSTSVCMAALVSIERSCIAEKKLFCLYKLSNYHASMQVCLEIIMQHFYVSRPFTSVIFWQITMCM